ncbi:MAG TPA: alanine--tRNA ligase [Chitinophagaceae bacterium]|nr:alanine--tRNA ligase [Chitinophagaceae bacterium]
MTSAEIRQSFLDFFRSKGHEIVPSAPIVVKNDPTLMFTNAGMNQFKDYFLGNKKPANKRVADTQKCLRVSGKHNDLEEVGVDTYHHTMFEMLGNWSFGDYFKKEAIEWSWELLTKIYRIPDDKLYVTVFGGDKNEKLPKDEEAIAEWEKWIPADRILEFGKKDNFWEMGDTGPCGPCTEIHVDCRSDEERKKTDGKTLVNKDHPQVIEIWNNVFIQFNRLKDGSLELLPAKHVDTGMGLERLVRVLQNKNSNYDTDVFAGTIAEVEKITKKKYEAGDSKKDIAFRVVADHIRAIGFTIADGQLPFNTGAGYVIRRILRRAVRYYYSYLDYKRPLLYQLLPGLAKQFENVFPELNKQNDFVRKVLKEEEDAFLRTIDKGLNAIQSVINIEIASINTKIKLKLKRFEQLKNVQFTIPTELLSFNDNIIQTYFNVTQETFNEFKNEIVKQNPISGAIAFELYDTYGFPIDLTKLVAAEKGLNVDEKAFESEMQKQKSRSRAATVVDTEDWIVLKEGNNKFIGYDSLEAKTEVLKYRKVKAKGKEAYQFVLEKTPFYAESGGQVGDTGELIINNEKLIITDTRKDNDLIIHFADSLPVDLSGEVIAKVDASRRKSIMLHHSATHLLHSALRKVLGTHVAQKGSLVNDEHLRFDFSHFAKITDDEIAQIETLVNEKMRENIPVVIKEMPKDEAIKSGAMALFGEKYGDIVRVVIIDPNYSIELCGGTHVGATGELGFFKIKRETTVAAGVRRIEAVSGKKAEDFVNEQFGLIRVIRDSLKNPKDISKSIESLQEESATLKKHIGHLEARQLVAIRNELLQKDEFINQVNFIGDIVEVSSPDAVKKLCFDMKNHLKDFVVVLCANIDGKPHVAISIADNVIAAKNLDANKIIKEHVAPLINGGGGGQKNLATAAGIDAGNLKQVIEKVKSLL